MSPYAFVLVWVLHSTALGLVALGVPAAFRLRHPGSLVRWWGYATLAVLVMPLVTALLPATGGTPMMAPAFLDAAIVAAVVPTPDAVGAWALSPYVMLGVLWAAGAGTRIAWLWAGHRRLQRIVDHAVEVTADTALERARALAPRSPFAPFDAHRLSVRATDHAAPCAYGWARVGVLVPMALQDRPEQERLAVYLHELVHVSRGDTVRAYGDELWRVLFWWQPAAWWLMARLQLAREHEVDAIVVDRAGGMRPYVEALLWCSSLAPARVPGLAIAGTRHALVQRVSLLGRGGTMTRTRRWMTELASVTVFAGLVAVSGTWSPLRAATAPAWSQVQIEDAGPLERSAVRPSLDAPAPRRTVAVEPVWTDPGVSYRLRAHLVIDATGRVAEARLVGPPATSRVPDGVLPDLAGAREAALVAIRQWQFEPPVAAPMLLVVDVTVGDYARIASHVEQVEQSLKALAAGSSPPLRIGGAVRPPKRLVNMFPIYPEAAKAAGVSGVVILEAVVDQDGAVKDVRVLRGIAELDAAAVEAVRQWRYEPTLLNGEAVPVIMTVTVNFTLQQ